MNEDLMLEMLASMAKEITSLKRKNKRLRQDVRNYEIKEGNIQRILTEAGIVDIHVVNRVEILAELAAEKKGG